MNDDDGLTPEEKRAMEALRADAAPPPAVEQATLARLESEGLIRPSVLVRREVVRLLAAAAALAIFATGLGVGRWTLRSGTATPVRSAPRFVLFLYDAPSEPAMTDAQMQERVSEYRNWAMGLRKRGAEIMGEKLTREREERLGPAAIGGAPLGGYFVISAKDWDAAMEVARSCPHLKHGGTIEVRQIEKT